MQITIADLLKTASEDEFLSKLANADQAQEGQEKTAVGAQGSSAGTPGAATAAAPIGGGDTAHGSVSPGGPVNIMDQQMGDTSANARVKLMDQAMRAAAGELTGAVAATRGAGTDEGHNAGTQPRSGMQEYANVASPQVQQFQDPHQPLEADSVGGGGGGGEPKAASAKPEEAMDLIARLAVEAEKVAAQNGAGQAAPSTEAAGSDVLTDHEKLAVARAQANEAIGAGLFMHEGIKHGLQKAASDGELAEIFAQPLADAHAAGLSAVAESPVMEAFCEKMASQIVSKVEKKLGISSDQ